VKFSVAIFSAFAAMSAFALSPSAITVKIAPSSSVYIMGERIDATIDVANASADRIEVGGISASDRLTVEVFRASDRMQYDRLSNLPFVRPFVLEGGEGQLLATHLDDYFAFTEETRYLVRAVLIHAGIRFESALKAIDVVPGIPCGGAMQMFSSHPGLKRNFELVHWPRNRAEHIFVKAADSTGRRWTSKDLGPVLRVTAPKISVMPSGEVIVLHRTDQDNFVRSVFWSLPAAFEFQGHDTMSDPETAGAERVKALYREAGGLKPAQKDKKVWWKVW